MCTGFCLCVSGWMSASLSFYMCTCDEPWLTALGEHSGPSLPMRQGHTKLHINLLVTILPLQPLQLTTAYRNLATL